MMWIGAHFHAHTYADARAERPPRPPSLAPDGTKTDCPGDAVAAIVRRHMTLPFANNNAIASRPPASDGVDERRVSLPRCHRTVRLPLRAVAAAICPRNTRCGRLALTKLDATGIGSSEEPCDCPSRLSEERNCKRVSPRCRRRSLRSATDAKEHKPTPTCDRFQGARSLHTNPAAEALPEDRARRPAAQRAVAHKGAYRKAQCTSRALGCSRGLHESGRRFKECNEPGEVTHDLTAALVRRSSWKTLLLQPTPRREARLWTHPRHAAARAVHASSLRHPTRQAAWADANLPRSQGGGLQPRLACASIGVSRRWRWRPPD